MSGPRSWQWKKIGTAASLAFALPFAAGFAAPAQAQCPWQPRNDGGSLPCIHGPILTATRYDPDGSGPAPEFIVVGGDFVADAGSPVRNMARFDPASGTWSPFDNSAFNSRVTALVPMPNGDLVATGFFSHSTSPTGSTQVGAVARWNGVAWSRVGNAYLGGNHVHAAVAMPNGDLVVGDDVGVMRWNGTTWTPLGSTGRIVALAALPGGAVAAAWHLGQPGQTPVTIGIWSGSTWAAIAVTPSYVPSRVYSLVVLPNGHLVATGENPFPSTSSSIAEWDGSAWQPLFGSGPFPSSPGSTCLLASGDLIVGSMGFAQVSVSRWNGSAWSAVGARRGSRNVAAVVEASNGNILVFESDAETSGGVTIGDRWNGLGWSRIATGTDGDVLTMSVGRDGTLAVGGNFTYLGGTLASGIASWDGASWTRMGTEPVAIGALARLPNGDLVAGGRFTTTSATPDFDVRRWDGSNWTTLGQITSPVFTFPVKANAMVVMPNGDLIAAVVDSVLDPVTLIFRNGGRVLRWSGSSWTQLATLTMSTGYESIYALAVLPNGDLVATGFFQFLQGVFANGIARWNGQTWSALGGGLNGGTGSCLLTTVSGDLIVGGSFAAAGATTAVGTARWNGASWSSMGSRSMFNTTSLLQLPDGDLLAGGSFSMFDALGRRAEGLARWNGTDWFATGVNTVSGTDGFHASAVTANGEIALAGFLSLGIAHSGFFGRIASTCSATATAVGVGCPSSGGSNTLRAETLPWIGSALALSGTGLPPHAFVAAGIGATAISQGALPLANLFALAGPGCDVLVAPDLLEILVAHGSVRATLRLPDSASLIGVSVHAQMAILEVDATGAPLAITSTNAVQLTIGSL